MILLVLIPAVIVLAVLERIWAPAALKALRFKGSCDHALAEPGETITWSATVENQSRLPIPFDGSQNMNILIGPENVNEAFRDTSVVMASYDIGDNMRGVIGGVGPTRMDYAKVTARLSYFADSLTRMFGKGELPPALNAEEQE